MASPQAEDGHIDIAHEIAEALCRINLSAYESRVMWFVLRKTYGWHKKIDRISYSQFEEGTGIHRRHLGPTIKKLIKRQIITCIGNGYLLEYGFQKDYEQWQGLNPNVTYPSNESLPKEVTSQQDKTLPVQGEIITDLGLNHYRFRAETLPKEVNTKEILQKKTTKENLQKKDKALINQLPVAVRDFLEGYEIILESYALKELQTWCNKLPVEDILKAFEETDKHKKYSWPYARKILQRIESEKNEETKAFKRR